MIITNLKATVPGAGKTTTAVKLFTELNKQNKKQNLIILTPSNKNKQNIIQMLRNNAVEGAERYVKTFRDFKQNFKRWQTFSRVYDSEAMEYVDKVSDTYYITTASKFHYKKTWDHVFIDEAGMISDKEMQDLLNHWKIKHLHLIDDLNQFSPIANIQKLDSGDSPVKDSVWNDDGSFYKLPIGYQFVLNKSMRAKDEKLNEVINMIKNGDFLEALLNCSDEVSNDLSENDWHIAYTNAKCEKINQLYEDKGLVSRYILIENDKKHGFSKSEILDADDYRFEKLKNDLAVEDGLDWEKWQEYYIRPAMCVTAHKLQGFTVPENAHVKIHLDDIVEGVYKNPEVKVEENEMIETIQKFLYVAVSRARRYDQVNVFLGKGDLSVLVETLQDLDSKMKPLVDEQLQDNPYWVGSADDEKLLQKLLEIVNTETEALDLEGEKEFWQKYSKDRKAKYSEDDVNYAKTHTYKECKKNKGWAETKVRNMRRSQVDQVKVDIIINFDPKEPNNTKISSSSYCESENREIDLLTVKKLLLERQKQQ